MRLNLLREKAVGELKTQIAANLDLYRNGDFNYLILDPAQSFSTDIELQESALSQLLDPVADQFFEPENCATMLSVLPDLTPFQAADERLWVLLSHTLLLNHTRKRWPIPDKSEDAEAHIKTHFFAQSQRQLERDNVGARLWWMGHLCGRIKSMSLKDALDVLLYRSDVRANTVERPTTAQSVPVFSALITKLAASKAGKGKLFERATFRSLMVHLNGLGGYKLLDALDRTSIEAMIDEVIAERLGVSSI